MVRTSHQPSLDEENNRYLTAMVINRDLTALISGLIGTPVQQSSVSKQGNQILLLERHAEACMLQGL
jgi:hypothetical protein